MEKKREFPRFSGQQQDVVTKLAQAVYRMGGSDDELMRIVSDEMLRLQLAHRLVIASGGFDLVGPEFLEFDGSMKFDKTADVSNMRVVDRTVFGGTPPTSAIVIDAVWENQCRLPSLYELIAIAREKWNGRDTVVALDSTTGRKCFPAIRNSGGNRELCMLREESPYYRWPVDFLFLAVYGK